MRQALAAVLIAVAGAAGAQTKAPAKKEAAPAPTIEVSGVLADAKGLLANKIVRVGPVDAQGNMLAIRGLGASSAAGTDPQATSGPDGRFTLTVARSFFRNQPDDRLGLRVSTDVGGGRMSTAHENAIVRFDSSKDKVDVGRVTLQPLKAR